MQIAGRSSARIPKTVSCEQTASRPSGGASHETSSRSMLMKLLMRT